ncbi:hypothetical protein KUTeg_023054 [Tegillarca granosa]|uniref:Cleavage and polyadenylation specificity factor subunit 6 n=1 Tax=Tegillarca granosa TaxID=220873 RepID=A0ABQ9E467_TEGGR|nr:hypothetical protein KUTeg_023054 [Tegillarca granosa]
MADGVDIDLYDNLEEGFDQDPEFTQDDDLYNDVITAPSSSEAIDHHGEGDSVTKSISVPSGYTGRRLSLYVGNLTWWTTDQDLTDAVASIGVTDLVEIKFYENRANGQSKGFAVVVVGSDNSSRLIFDKLPKKELHGQVPQVTHCNRGALAQFEAQARKGEPPPQNGSPDDKFSSKNGPRGSGPPNPRTEFKPNRNIRPPGPVPTGPPPPGPLPPGGPPPPFAGPPRGPPMSGPPPPVGLPPPPRVSGPPPPGPMLRGPPPPLRGPPPPDPRGPPLRSEWDRPPGHHFRPPAPFPAVGPPPPQAVPPPGARPPGPGMLPTAPPMGLPPPGHPPVPAPHVNPAFFPPQHGIPPPSGAMPPISTPDPYRGPPPVVSYPNDHYRPSSDRYERSERAEPASPALSEQEFEEIFQRNKTVSSSAISRAVQDASAGEFASAIETLVTAISLIKQSKIATDDRCKILISSLQDTLHGIEEKSYGSKSTTRRSRSRERERDREKRSRSHRSRSRDREYRERSRDRERHYDESSRHRERDRDRDREREREREYSSRRH